MVHPEKETLAPPEHIAIIMDGNGRWAKKRGLPRTAGHAAGAESFRRIANYCRELGVKYLTVYAFSTENWKRSADEVGAIMGLLKKYLLTHNGFRMPALQSEQEAYLHTMREKQKHPLHLNICLHP